MAIRKDLDDMLNILKNGQQSAEQRKKSASASSLIKTRRDSKIDNMSVDDLLSTLAISKVVEETAAKSPEVKPEEKIEVQEKPRRKRVVITGELPDYEALREQELERERLERERIEAEKRAAEKAERDRVKAEKARAEAEKQAAEESKNRLMAERRAAETARMEAERKAEIARIAAEKKAAEQAKLEAQRKAAEEARLEAERKAEEEKRLEAERKAAEEKRIEAERQAAEEKRLEAERQAAEEARLEAERKAAEEARLEAERKAAEEARLEAERQAEEEQDQADGEDHEQSDSENAEEPSVDDLMDAAIAAAKAAEAQFLAAEEAAQELSEYDPVENMIDHIRGDAEKAVEEINNPTEPEKPAVDELPPSLSDIEAELDDELFGGKKKKKLFGRKKDETETVDVEAPENLDKPTSKLHKILDETPDEIIAGRRESVEGDDDGFAREGGKLKKTLYAIFGVIFFLHACIGLITVIAKTVSFFGRYSSGDTHKSAFSEVVYPAVIMDIETFSEPSELPSEQIITAAVWSMIMSDNALDGYEKTFDVVKIPAADVESYAVKLFGDDIPALTHKTVGPAESRFYYNEDTQSYNVSVSPVTYTYSPSIRSATKNGSEYTVVVDYIDELPEWLPETSSKKVEFTLAETNDGYRIRSMKILSTSSNSL